MVRVLVVFGSETGNAERGIRRWTKKWAEREGLKFEVCDIVTGNSITKQLGGDGEANAKNLEFLISKFKYDVLLVATSSYGNGDPPSNMGEFLGLLSHEASMRSDALVGMQHAVLGFGSTTYETFQNVPRLTDKFLGECGSRRIAQRAEIDEHDPNPGEEAEYKRWGEDVFKALQNLPKVRCASPAVRCRLRLVRPILTCGVLASVFRRTRRLSAIGPCQRVRSPSWRSQVEPMNTRRQCGTTRASLRSSPRPPGMWRDEPFEKWGGIGYLWVSHLSGQVPGGAGRTTERCENEDSSAGRPGPTKSTGVHIPTRKTK